MNKVERFRVVLLSVLGGIVVVLLVYGTLYSLNLAPGIGTTTGPEYRTLDRDLQTNPITVVEFFSYACPHCANLEPMLEDWIDDLPENVEFSRIHVSVDTLTTRLAKTYLVLESQSLLEENHRRVFEAIHDRNVTFLSDDQIADFMDGNGIDSERFLSTMDGYYIDRRLKADQEFASNAEVLGVPALLIGDKFMVSSSGGIRQLLDTSEWLIDELLEGRDPSPEAEADDSDSLSIDIAESDLEIEAAKPIEADSNEAASEADAEADQSSDSPVTESESSTP